MSQPDRRMRINIFEGTRRIMRLVMVLWVIAAASFVYIENEPRLIYSTVMPERAFALTDECPFSAQERSVTRDVDGYPGVYIRLCFLPTSYLDPKEGTDQIVFKIDTKDGETWWTSGDKYSADVTGYMNQRTAAFKLDPSDAKARASLRAQMWKNYRNGALIIVGGVVVLFVLQFVMGWIVRGFAGIPMGQDSRPSI
ncbi:MAG TPA: hypothetical protein VI485_17405 [Vicinamibacterales bacterium]|nr:hypothetical protein [Vicinamibacterales bacterium]